ncbi:MAG: Clp protease N-terminal domain-containing protein, partial [Dysgonamonadaceae bacterium]|nr:Clp protease N-terminal domain-containing protein [Dysgonamonadaceae bacterium]
MDTNFTQRVRDIMVYSREEAERLQNNYIGPEHLLLGILRDGEGLAIQLLQDFDVDLKALKESIDDSVRNVQESLSIVNELVINKSTEKVLKMSILESRLSKSSETDAEHILLALLKEK